MKAYRDDAEILAMALEDGCYQSLTAALAKMDGQQSAVIVGNRIYLVHATPGDSGYSCFDAGNPVAMVDLLLKLAPVIGEPLDADALADYRAGIYRAPMPECLFRSNALSRTADELEALRSSVIDLTAALGIAQTHLDARQAVIDELTRQLETLRVVAVVDPVIHDAVEVRDAVERQGSAKGKNDDLAAARVVEILALRASGLSLKKIADRLGYKSDNSIRYLLNKHDKGV